MQFVFISYLFPLSLYKCFCSTNLISLQEKTYLKFFPFGEIVCYDFRDVCVVCGNGNKNKKLLSVTRATCRYPLVNS